MKTVGEVCRAANVTRKTLYYYDRIGLLKPTERSGGQNYKLYDDDAVTRLNQIRSFRRAGLRIIEIQKIIHTPSLCSQVVREALQRQRREMDQLSVQIEAAEQLLRDMKE